MIYVFTDSGIKKPDVIIHIILIMIVLIIIIYNLYYDCVVKHVLVKIPLKILRPLRRRVGKVWLTVFVLFYIDFVSADRKAR